MPKKSPELDRDEVLDRALKLRSRGQKREALKLLAELQKQNHNDPEILFSLAETLDNLGQFPGALPRYHRAIQLDPHHSRCYEIYLYLCSTYHKLGKDNAARVNLRKARNFGRRSPLQAKLIKALRLED